MATVIGVPIGAATVRERYAELGEALPLRSRL